MPSDSQPETIRCLVRATSNRDDIDSFDVEIVVGDLSDEHALRHAVSNCDYVINFAGTTKALGKRGFRSANVIGPDRIAKACAAQDSPPTLVHVSSLAAAGPSVRGKPRTEAEKPSPVSNYGRSKREGEEQLLRYCQHVPISIVRPPIVLGPGDRDGFELFRSIAKFGIHLIPGFQSQEVSLVHSDDLCNAVLRIAEQGERLGETEGEGVYFVADPTPVRYDRLGELIASTLGRRRVWKLRFPLAGIWAVASVNEAVSRIHGRPHILNFDKGREASAGSWACDSGKFQAAFGDPVALPLADRLTEIAEWYRERGWI